MKMLSLVIIQFVITGMFAWVIVTHIEKHSVHPEYGNYKKVSFEGKSCQPWDSCR